MSELGLKSGDLIEILSAAEILSTLNDEGALDQLPFMPEMATYCGKRFMVDRRFVNGLSHKPKLNLRSSG